jgi:DNA-directed RNA polymerase specialized sigma24 family protein
VALVKETNEYVPIDGFHRLNAIDWLAKQSDIPVDLEHVAIRYSEFDTMSEAIIAAAGVNATHGLKRKKGDIQNAIRKLLEVDTTRFMKSKYQLDKATIIQVVGCSDRMYQQESKSVREDLEAARTLDIFKLHDTGLSHREIAERVGCGDRTVGNILGAQKTHNAENAQSKNEQQEGQHEEITTGTDTEDSAPSIFTHITEAGVVDCPWETDEEQEEAPEPSFSETNAEARIRLFIEDLSEEEKAYALKLLAV